MVTVVVVGLGPAGPELVTAEAAQVIAAAPPGARFLRTSRHPAAAAVPGARAFDDLYEAADSFDAVYAGIVDALVEATEDQASSGGGPVVYAVPGSPSVAEATVGLLRADPRVEVRTVPGVSFLDLAWDRLGVDPMAAGVRLVDAAAFPVEAAGSTGPLIVGQCWNRDLLSGLKLAVAEAPESGAVLLHHLGLPDEAVVAVSWSDLDRALEPDHLTSVWIPQLAAPVGAELLRLAELVRTLRQRCPWDREQTHSSLTRHLLEESYEVLEAIEGLDRDGRRTPAAFAHLEEELGDLLFQVYFHATLAAEEGQFGLADVARGIHDKLVGRHPHVFGDVAVDSAEQVVTNWERIKKKEKGRRSVMDGVPGNLPALHHADKVQRRAGSVGFDWDGVEGPLAKIDEELAEVRTALAAHPARPGQVPDPEVKAEIGDLLFSVVNVARHAGVDPEAALRASSAEFVRRFRLVEERAGAEGVDMDAADLATLDRLWNEVKAAPGGAGAPPGGGPGA
jgi:tetrapyrrole methylase family protein / MazG family protein